MITLGSNLSLFEEEIHLNASLYCSFVTPNLKLTNFPFFSGLGVMITLLPKRKESTRRTTGVAGSAYPQDPDVRNLVYLLTGILALSDSNRDLDYKDYKSHDRG